MWGSELTLGRYRLLRQLGSGGMGEVYLACSHGAAGFEKLVAVKLVRPELAADPEQRERLRAEARLGGRLSHEHLVEILDLGEERGCTFLAMEYVRGFSLGHVLRYLGERDERLDGQVGLAIVRRVARGLAHLHDHHASSGQAAPITHGDVSPSNVLLAVDGRVKVGDFGVASAVANAGIGGKLSYLPSEAFAGAAPHPRWDVFALGALLYEIVTGVRAFPASTLADRHGVDRERPAQALRAAGRDDVADLVARALAPPEERLPDARAFLDGLDLLAPPGADDRALLVGYVADVFERPDFVRDHGELPTSSNVAAVAGSAIDVEETQPAVIARSERPLRFGLSPAVGSELARRAGDILAERLESRVGSAVRPVVLGDYETVVDCLVRGDIDVAWMPPGSYAAARRRGAGLVAVARRRGNGFYHSVIAARRDRGIEHLEQLRGEVLACVDRQSSSGYLYAVAEVERHLGPCAEVLGGLEFFGTHRRVCEAVAAGWAAAGATYAALDEDGRVVACAWEQLTPRLAGELVAVHVSPRIPSDNVAHRPGLEPLVVDRVRAALCSLGEDADGRDLLAAVFHAEGFEIGSDGAYSCITELLTGRGRGCG